MIRREVRCACHVPVLYVPRLPRSYCLMFKRHVHEEDALDIDEDSNLIHRHADADATAAIGL